MDALVCRASLYLYKVEFCTGLVRCSRSRPVPIAVIPVPVPVPQCSILLPSRSRSFHSRSHPGPVAFTPAPVPVPLKHKREKQN